MSWRQILRQNFTCLEKLCAFLEIDALGREKLTKNPSFPLNLPKRLAEKIEKNCIHDPIFLQFVPRKEELSNNEGFSANPVGDMEAKKTEKCLRKYEGRVLLLPTGACAMHCRYCFRKSFSYESFQTGFLSEIELIRNDTTIKEVILSGGDPLSLSDTVLEKLLEDLGQISHLKRIRFHSRFLIGIPERIDDAFLALLKKCSKKIWFVIHCNHPNELDADVIEAISKIQKLGIVVLNQAVLLKGVNDSVSVLQSLFETLSDHGVLPYYLHQLDKVENSSHFEVTEIDGLFMMKELKKRLSGYALPRFVKEVAGESSKSILH